MYSFDIPPIRIGLLLPSDRSIYQRKHNVKYILQKSFHKSEMLFLMCLQLDIICRRAGRLRPPPFTGSRIPLAGASQPALRHTINNCEFASERAEISICCRDVEDAVPYDGMRRTNVGADTIRPRRTDQNI